MEDIASNFRPSSGSYFTPLLISLAGIVSTTLAVIAYHFIVVKFCMRHRQRQRQRILEVFSNLSPQANLNINNLNGVDEKVLSSIPILSYSTKDGQIGLHQSECVICLGELEDGDMVRLLPNCKHVFHNPCIDKWFLQHTNCPVCRAPIAAPVKYVEPLPADQETQDQEVRDPFSSIECPNSTSNLILSPNSHEELRGLLSVQLPKPNHLLRNCVSLVLLPIEGSNKQQRFVNGLERSLSLDLSHILINVQRECDDQKPSSSSSSPPPPHNSKAVLVECGSFRERSLRQFDRMSTVLIRSLSQLRVGQSSSMANGREILPC
ncbi:RING-H2 finger protein ATL5-like [Argentina anserina]|uniref:RING-H2 finger protein ATL5-like n=1 Tax=Argentina anserina TaxID=57926 RepID=UPI0021766430|nr:RING-H2 finger protein ATL5-like [Potentilla anserina]